MDEYLDALEREMEASAPLMEGRILDTLYIGGGTPTTLEPSQSRRLIGMIRQYFDLSALQAPDNAGQYAETDRKTAQRRAD